MSNSKMRKMVIIPLVTKILLGSMLFAACGSSDNDKDNGGGTPVEPPIETVSDVKLYVTSSNKSNLLTEVPLNFNKSANMSPNTVTINPAVKFQELDGFGVAITGSSCYNLLKMSAADRDAILRETFDPVKGNGMSYIRISIGCSDFSMSEFTWCDTKGIENFKVHDEDRTLLFPILREILAINPDVKIMGSPWTPPTWMKVNNLTDLQPYTKWTSGQLNPAYYQDYAEYFVKWIQAMDAEGFDIETITIQNEPLNRGNSASMYMTWQEQRDFIKQALGPAFKKNNIKSKILVFDHNYNYDNVADQKSYPLNIYNDPEADQYITGSAWHAYGGSNKELDVIHAARPDKDIYFTETSIGSWMGSRPDVFVNDLMGNMRDVCLGTINRYCKGIVMWNYMLDDKGAPYRPGGCGTCYGAIDISSADYKTLTRNSHYYTMAHLSKVIKPGAVRIESSGMGGTNGLHYSAFQNPDGTFAVVLLNDSASPLKHTIDDGKNSFTYTIPARSVASYRWKK